MRLTILYKDLKIYTESDDIKKTRDSSSINGYFKKTKAMGTLKVMQIERNYYNMLINAGRLQAERNTFVMIPKNVEKLIFEQRI